MARLNHLATSDETLVVTIDLPLPMVRAFAWWTEPRLLRLWWPSEAETDPRPGGMYHFSWPTQDWHLRGRYVVCDPLHGLRFTWRWDHDGASEPERIVTVTYTETATETRLRLEHGPYAPTPEDQDVRLRHHLAGWEHFLPRLETRMLVYAANPALYDSSQRNE